MTTTTKTSIDDLQFDIRIRTRGNFKDILRLKKARTEDVKQLFKKMGIDVSIVEEATNG